MNFDHFFWGCIFGFHIVIGVRAFLQHRKSSRARAITEAAEREQRKKDLLAALGYPNGYPGN